MNDFNDLIQKDLRHVWHPCAQMKDYESFPPLVIQRAKGSYLYDANNQPIIDAISSWWCKSLGHCHDEIKSAVISQMDQFEHIIAANTCSEPLTLLSAHLVSYFQTMKRCFYADNGSTAIEIALKMALQYQSQTGHSERTEILSFENGYHGETLFTLSVNDCDLYSQAYSRWLMKIPHLKNIPYVTGETDPLWNDIGESRWRLIEEQLENMKNTLAVIVFEPVLQGAGGMLIYSPNLLTRLRQWANDNHVLLIADEIMTGFGRTGKMFACEHAGIEPDFVCLSKGLTSGYAPMSVVLTSDLIYQAFYDDYTTGKAFLHSNTFCGYALAARAALTVCKIYDRDHIIDHMKCDLKAVLETVQKKTSALKNIRAVGYLAAAELVDTTPRAGFELMKKAVKNGLLIRPLGNTLYLLPPLNMSVETLHEIQEKLIFLLKK